MRLKPVVQPVLERMSAELERLSAERDRSVSYSAMVEGANKEAASATGHINPHPSAAAAMEAYSSSELQHGTGAV